MDSIVRALVHVHSVGIDVNCVEDREYFTIKELEKAVFSMKSPGSFLNQDPMLSRQRKVKKDKVVFCHRPVLLQNLFSRYQMEAFFFCLPLGGGTARTD